MLDEREFDLTDAAAAAFCPACGAGYGAGPTRCADCGRELISRSEIEAILAPAGADEEPETRDEPPLEESAFSSPEFDLSDPDAVSFCPRCGCGYRAGPLVCVDCDAELRPRSWVETRTELESGVSIDEVFLVDIESSFQADVLRSALRDQDVLFVIRPTASHALRFLVRPVDLDLARQVLADVDEIPPLELPEEE